MEEEEGEEMTEGKGTLHVEKLYNIHYAGSTYGRIGHVPRAPRLGGPRTYKISPLKRGEKSKKSEEKKEKKKNRKKGEKERKKKEEGKKERMEK